ncbi:MAG: glycoside hydrolase family 1 protein, partial [Gemmatimonadaceae bacterium]
MDSPPSSTYFIFATGIGNSYPTIQGGRLRVDEMEKCGHYREWRRDFDLAESIGVSHLRYGPPLHKVWLAPDRYDWEFADLTFGDLSRRTLS